MRPGWSRPGVSGPAPHSSQWTSRIFSSLYSFVIPAAARDASPASPARWDLTRIVPCQVVAFQAVGATIIQEPAALVIAGEGKTRPANPCLRHGLSQRLEGVRVEFIVPACTLADIRLIDRFPDDSPRRCANLHDELLHRGLVSGIVARLGDPDQVAHHQFVGCAELLHAGDGPRQPAAIRSRNWWPIRHNEGCSGSMIVSGVASEAAQETCSRLNSALLLAKIDDDYPGGRR